MLDLLQLPLKWWNAFFHTRTSPSSSSTPVFVLCGRLRIFYAILLLLDRWILSYDFHFFFLSGIMPCDQHYNYSSINSSSLKPSSLLCTIAGMVHPTQIPYVYYTFFYVGILNAVLLLLGITPKLQLLLLHINMLSFQNHSALIWDGEDSMFKIWNFLFLFLPLHHVTIYDQFRHLFYYDQKSTHSKSVVSRTETWPMWPFRLWQMEICCIYMGAGYTKLSTVVWYSGNALYRIIHTNDFFGGPITPDFIFNRRGPLQLLTWSSLMVECSCIILIWPLYTRRVMLVAIILLHLGIEGAMNMHCFEWLTMIGWLFFLVEREDMDNVHNTTTTTAAVAVNETNTGSTKDQVTKNTPLTSAATASTDMKHHRIRRTIINLFLLIAIPTFVFDTIPFNELTRFIPSYAVNVPLLQRLESILLTMHEFRTKVAQPLYYIPFVHAIGLYQGVWDLFTGAQDHNYRIETIIHYRNDTFASQISPDWSNMTWYEKKRWQRVMTFYENFVEVACMDCYASYYAEQYGPKNVVRSVRLVLHKQQPPIEPPGNVFDMDYFFKPAKEVLVNSAPEEIFLLNYCDDAVDECEELMKLGYCASNNNNDGSDKILLQMTKNCRRSCELCNFDATALELGNRVSVFYILDEQYFDGTIIDTRMVHTVRQYLILYDGYEDKPEWASSVALRRLGVRLAATGNEKSANVGVVPTEDEPSSKLASSMWNSVVDSSDDEVTGTESEEILNDEL